MGSSQLFEITHNVAAGGGQPAYVTTNSYTCTLVYTAAHSYWYLPQGVKIDIGRHTAPCDDIRAADPAAPDGFARHADRYSHRSRSAYEHHIGPGCGGSGDTVDQDLRPTVSEPYARGLNQIFLDSRAATDPLGAIVLANAYARC